MRSNLVVAVVGPTTTGKSDWGIALCQRFGGEVISADSRQVYIGMDIGTGKVQDQGGVRHWMLDVAEPSYPFTVAEYQRMAMPVVDRLLSEGRLPVIVGGTGLYVRALLDGLVFPQAPADESIRALSLSELQERLRALDAAAEVDWQNPRRLMRALEIVQHTGRPLAESRRMQPPSFDRLVMGIDMDFDIVRERIHRRLLARLSEGMVDEVRGLAVSPERLEAFGLEYRYVGRYLAGTLTYDDMVAQLEQAIVQYARRQMTWFRKYGDVHSVRTLAEAVAQVEVVRRGGGGPLAPGQGPS